MPVIPTDEQLPKVNAGSLAFEGVRVPEASGGSAEIARLGAALSEISNGLRETEKRVSEARARANVGEFYSHFMAEAVDDDDPDTLVKRFDEKAKGSIDEHAASIGDTTTRDIFTSRERERAARWRLRVQETQIGLRRERGLGVLSEALDKFGEQAIAATDPDARADAVVAGLEAIDDARGGDFITPEARMLTRRRFLDRVGMGFGQRLIEANPERLLDIENDPAFQDLSPEKRLALRRGAEAELDRRERVTETAEREASALRVSDLEIAVRRGEQGVNEIEAAYDGGRGWLSPAKRTQLTAVADAVNRQADIDHAEIGRVALAMQTGQMLDPKDAKDRKAVDLHAERVFFPALTEMDPARVVDATVDYVAKVGLVPSALKKNLRSQLRGEDDQARASAADIMARLEERNPALLDGFTKQDRREAMMIARNVEAGMPEPAAVKRASEAIHDADDPAREVRKRRLRDEKLLDRAESVISNELAEPEFFSLEFGEAKIPDAIIGEFRDSYEQHYLATGDDDAAEKLAVADIKRVWAVSRVGGERRLMKYAPERYGLAGLSDQDNAEWMSEQLAADLKTVGLSGDGVQLEADIVTAREPQPSWVVMRRNESGALEPVFREGRLMRWRPEWSKSPKRAALNKEHDEAAAQALETGRRDRARGMEDNATEMMGP